MGSVDALALDVEEEALVALEVGARAALLAVLPRVPHHLPVGINLVRMVMDKIGLQWNYFNFAFQRLGTSCLCKETVKVYDFTSVAHQEAPFSDPALVHLL